MAERSKTFRPSATLAVVHASPRFVARTTRALNSESRRRMEGEGNFPPCKALKSLKMRTAPTQSPTPAPP